MAKSALPILLGIAAIGAIAFASSDSKASPAPSLPPGGGGSSGPPVSLPPGAPPQLAACIDSNMNQAVVNKLAAEAQAYMLTGKLPAGVSSTADWANQLEAAGYPKAAGCVRSIPAGGGGGGLPNLPPGIPNPGGIGGGTPGTVPGGGQPKIPSTVEEAAAQVPSLFDIFQL